MKRPLYIVAFSFLGALMSFILHALIEIPILGRLSSVGTYAGMTFDEWYLVHAIGTPLLLCVGIAAGFFAGRYFWHVLYTNSGTVREEIRARWRISEKKRLYLQVFILLGGTLFSWTALVSNFNNFYGIYETIFRFRDCAIPNPFVTPCFFGAVAFLASLVWAFSIRRGGREKSERWLRNFLAFGTVFAFSVFLYEASQYYRWFTGPDIGCIPGASPWKTPCLYGGIIFLVAFLNSVVIVKRAGRGISSHRAFTLIEVLVVVAIIGVLSAIILPTFNSARERARDVKRKAEITQFGRFLTLGCPMLSAGPGTYDLGTVVAELRATNPQSASFLKNIPHDPAGDETTTLYRYVVDSSRKCALYANLESGKEPVTLQNLSAPSPGGGTGVLRASEDGWNDSPLYFQVSN